MEFVRIVQLRTVFHALQINIYAKSVHKETLYSKDYVDHALPIACIAILMGVILAMMDPVSWGTQNWPIA